MEKLLYNARKLNQEHLMALTSSNEGHGVFFRHLEADACRVSL